MPEVENIRAACGLIEWAPALTAFEALIDRLDLGALDAGNFYRRIQESKDPPVLTGRRVSCGVPLSSR